MYLHNKYINFTLTYWLLCNPNHNMNLICLQKKIHSNFWWIYLFCTVLYDIIISLTNSCLNRKFWLCSFNLLISLFCSVKCLKQLRTGGLYFIGVGMQYMYNAYKGIPPHSVLETAWYLNSQCHILTYFSWKWDLTCDIHH